MMTDTAVLFRSCIALQRRQVQVRRLELEEVAETALELQKEVGSVLIVVNTKASSTGTVPASAGRANHVHFLSTAMCPIHRMKVLDEVKECLNPDAPSPVVCQYSTDRAGVDVDFGSVIRYLAGLESIAQAAGRCKSQCIRPMGKVLIVNPRTRIWTTCPRSGGKGNHRNESCASIEPIRRHLKAIYRVR